MFMFVKITNTRIVKNHHDSSFAICIFEYPVSETNSIVTGSYEQQHVMV